MNEQDSRSANDSPFSLLDLSIQFGTLLGAFVDAMNLRHLRSELYDRPEAHAGRAETGRSEKPPLTLIAPSWSVPPSLTQQNLSDQQIVLRARTAPSAREVRVGPV
jgi:hypothetical protein